MKTSTRGLAIGIAAFTLALTVFLGTLLQIGAVAGDAWAQSSVRPPDDAVNTREPGFDATPTLQGSGASSVRPPTEEEWQPGFVPSPNAETPLQGSSLRAPEPEPTNAPSEPGMKRPVDLADPSGAQPTQPLGTEGVNSDATLWGAIRHGVEGTVSIPNDKLAVMIQPNAYKTWESWRAQGGPLQMLALYVIGGMLALLVLFYLIRGRIRIKGGKSGVVIERFKGIERMAHWTLAVSFIVLALSGLNLLFGKDYIMPLIGKEAFATVTMAGKWLHTNMSWAFMLALVLVFVMWVVHNIPTLLDVKWFLKGGGIIGKGHPPARKFNAGQKIIFWATILLGASVSASGLALLFPYELPMFAKTFAILNTFGAEAVWGEPLPTNLTLMQEQQYAQIWHTMVALAMIAIILAHIYIGTLGMEGAFDAMGSGWVDRNWAEEHHDLWVEEKDRKADSARAGVPKAQPAE